MTPDIGLANWFRQRALRSPERLALRFEGRDWTYAEMQTAIEDCAARLAALGIVKGERVAFLGLNQPMFFFVMFAAARLGAIFVPLNFRLTGPELAFMIEDCAASVLIVDAQLRPAIEPQRERLTALKAFLAAENVADWTAGGAPGSEAVAAREDDIAMIMYTSGTTGRPKGAMLTHGNFWWNNANSMHAFDVLADDVTLTAAPVFHIGGLNVTTLVTLQKGGLVVLHRAFDPGRALADIAAQKVTTMFGVPAMFQFMAQHPAFAETDLSSLRMLVVGGAPCPAPVLKAYLARGVSMQQGYGLTETAPMVSFLAPEYALQKLGSSGKPALFVEVKIVDSNGATDRGAAGAGRNPRARAERDPGLLGPSAGDRAGDRPGRLVPHRRCGLFRRRGLPHHQRPHQGHDHQRRRERLSGGSRKRADAPSGDRRGRGDRRTGRAMGRRNRRRSPRSGPADPWRSTSCARSPANPCARYKLPRRLEIVAALPRNATGKILKYQLRQAYARPQNAAQ